MSSPTVVAEPYAKAIFECAVESNSLELWRTFLTALEKALYDEALSRWVESPSVDVAVINQAFQEMLDKQNGTAEQKRFVELLIENNRLGLCGEISSLFNEQMDQHTHLTRVNVLSAIELDDAQKASLFQALEARYQSQVEINFSIDPTLIGGVRIEQGDKVIDASINRRFKDLENEILQ